VRSAAATTLGTLGTLHALGAFDPLGSLHALGPVHSVGSVGPHDAIAAPVLLPVGPAILATVFTTDIPGCAFRRTVFPANVPSRTFRRAVGPAVFATDIPGCAFCRTVFLANVAGGTLRRTVSPPVFLPDVGRRALGENDSRRATQYDDRRYCCCNDAFLRQHSSAPFLENPSQGLDRGLDPGPQDTWENFPRQVFCGKLSHVPIF